MAAVRTESAILLAAIANLSDDQQKAAAALDCGLKKIGLNGTLQNAETALNSLESAFAKLGSSSQQIKSRVIDAACATVLFDGEITLREAQLLQTIANVLDCPLPSKYQQSFVEMCLSGR